MVAKDRGIVEHRIEEEPAVQHFWVDFAVETGRIQEPVHLVDLGLERDKEASIVIEQWCKQYNTVRPESALGYRPPTPETSIPMDHKPPMH